MPSLLFPLEISGHVGMGYQELGITFD